MLVQKTTYPFPYQGSKRRLASYILSYFPLKIDRLIEPFSGSAAVSIAVAYRKLADKFWINDANVQLTRLWNVILASPHALCDSYSAMWDMQKKNPTEYYKFIQSRYFLHRRAVDLFFLLHRSANSIVRFTSIGGFSNTSRPDRLGCHPNETRERIMRVHELLSCDTTVTSIDYVEVLSCAGDGDFVYIDPPYHDPHRSSGNYTGVFDHDIFCVQLDNLNRKKVPYILSYGNKDRDSSNGLSFSSDLNLTYVKIKSGKMGLLSGGNSIYESLYISKAAISRLGSSPNI